MKKSEALTVAVNVMCLVMICAAVEIESPQYTIVHSESDFEVRLYRSSVWMSAPALDISFEKATWNGFHRLFQFTEGANLNFSRIPMTLPVLTTTVPAAGPLQSQGYYVSLYLPVKFQATPPLPLPQLNIKPYEFSSHCVAVRMFSGFAKDERVVKEAQKLATTLSSSPWAHSQTRPGYSIAQYNTPFRIVKRKNEVWVDIDAPELGCKSVGVATY
ncbi:heme-binding protein 2 [Cajanus cajan]|uniref:Heme-binding protein 2 n=1 Tax=Cajanus cajan TaxID=3821 RepID=A0A151TTB7_CAJCA|nr:heme-binding protein 2 [Cajanus cajan]XP_020213741.1 heme-binding protein 2 [Cajanus cajan]KYP70254.1 Heme-binding protein 2 [Cajanus cajan]